MEKVIERDKAHQHDYNTTNPSTSVSTTPSPSPSKPPLPPKPSLPPNESAGGSHHIVYSPLVFSSGTSPLQPAKRKKGRPRKYGYLEQALGANKKPQKLSLGAGASHSGSSEKPQSAGLGNAAQGFIPHVINVVAGEDVGQTIIKFIQQSKRELCILSASGTISNVSLHPPATSGANTAYEGRFDIISLSGSYVRNETGGMSGGLSVCLSNSDGRIFGGGVGGPLKAAGPVQVILATFMIDRKKDVSANVKGDASLPPSSNFSFRPVFEAPGRNLIDASGSKLPSSVAGSSVSNISFQPVFEAPGRNPNDASGSKLPSSVAGSSVSNISFQPVFEAPGRNPNDASGSKLPSSVAGSSVSNISFQPVFEAPGRNPNDASGSKLPSSVAGSSNVSFCPAFEAPERNPIDVNDDHQGLRRSHFMTQPQGQHLASSPTDLRIGLDDRTAFELRGKTGHEAHRGSPGSLDHDYFED